MGPSRPWSDRYLFSTFLKRKIQLARRPDNMPGNRQPTPIFERIISAELARSRLKPFSRPFSLAHAAVKHAHQFDTRKFANYYRVFQIQPRC
jgi:hypothetical protein